MTKWRLAMMLWVLATAACDGAPNLPGAGLPRPPAEQILRAALGAAPESLDPAKARLPQERELSRLLWDPLLRPSPDLRDVDGAAAASYDVSPDGLTYTFHLRPGIVYGDRHPVVAGDFLYAWRRLIDPRLASPSAYFFSRYIRRGQEVAALGPVSDAAKIDAALETLGLSTPDDATFQVTLARPCGCFKWVAALPAGAPLRADVVSREGARWPSTPESLDSNGAFRLEAVDAGRSYTLAANEFHLPAAPHLRRLVLSVSSGEDALNRYRRGDLDLVPITSSAAQQLATDRQLGRDVVHAGRLETDWIAFNSSRAPFDDGRVRLAIARALDRDAYVRSVLDGGGMADSTLVPSMVRGARRALTATQGFSARSARDTLNSAGAAADRLPAAKLLVRDTVNGRKTAAFVQKQLKDVLGVSIGVETVASATDFDRRLRSGDYDLAGPISWQADYPDQQGWFDLFQSTSGDNLSQWRRGNYDQLVQAAGATGEQGARDELYAQAQRLLLAEAPAAFMAHREAVVLRRGYVAGVVSTSYDDDELPGDLFSESIQIRQH